MCSLDGATPDTIVKKVNQYGHGLILTILNGTQHSGPLGEYFNNPDSGWELLKTWHNPTHPNKETPLYLYGHVHSEPKNPGKENYNKVNKLEVPAVERA